MPPDWTSYTRKRREKLTALGLVRKEVWIPPYAEEKLREIEARLRKMKPPHGLQTGGENDGAG